MRAVAFLGHLSLALPGRSYWEGHGTRAQRMPARVSIVGSPWRLASRSSAPWVLTSTRLWAWALGIPCCAFPTFFDQVWEEAVSLRVMWSCRGPLAARLCQSPASQPCGTRRVSLCGLVRPASPAAPHPLSWAAESSAHLC